jgi:hypothetical protein
MKRTVHSICAALLVGYATLIVHAQPATKTTAVPRIVKFSGVLTDAAGKPLAGVVGVTFSLYEDEQAGAPIWMETQNVPTGSHGEYTVLLGSTRNDGIPAEIFGASQRWLGVQAQGESESPRVLMTSVPYSLKAVDAETLGGLPPSAFALAGAPNRAALNESAASVKPARPDAAVSPDQTGSGTANYITIWTAATTLGNSKLYQTTAGSVGLGTTTPAARLEAVNPAATGTGVLGDASSTTGANVGVAGKTASTAGTGVIGSATATSGTNYGVYGATVSPNAISVYGLSTNGTGVAGAASSPTAYGVYGANSGTTGNAFGTYGTSASPTGYGVFGTNTTTTGHAYGVAGANASTAGTGVLGQNTATSGSTFGVYGSVSSPNGIAVEGDATSGTGVVGTTTSTTGYGVYGSNAATSGAAYGVAGITASTSGVGVQAVSNATSGTNYGLYASVVSPSGTAVYGTTTSGTGVAGGTASPTGYGVYGGNSATTGNAYGVYGTTASTAGIGVLGAASATSGTTYGIYGASVSSSGIGVYGTAPTGGYAGEFAGNVKITGNLTVTGTVSKGGGAFRIDHPLDPEHKYLYHSFVESPDMMNIYNGVTTLSRHGDAVVKLPDWFDALNRDFRYQLTCIGGFAPVYIASEVSGNQFKIAGGRPGMKVSWQVTGIRKDAFANEHRIPVEEDKP